MGSTTPPRRSPLSSPWAMACATWTCLTTPPLTATCLSSSTMSHRQEYSPGPSCASHRTGCCASPLPAARDQQLKSPSVMPPAMLHVFARAMLFSSSVQECHCMKCKPAEGHAGLTAPTAHDGQCREMAALLQGHVSMQSMVRRASMCSRTTTPTPETPPSPQVTW